MIAKDDSGLTSLTTPVQAKIAVTPVIDVNITAGVNPTEGGVAGIFTVTLDSPAPIGGLTVNYTKTGTATLTTDYTFTAGSNITALTGSSFTIAAGQTSASLNINALTDPSFDPNETINLTLTAGIDYQLVQNSPLLFAPRVDYATLTSQDFTLGDVNNDGKPDLVIANLSAHTVSVMLRNADNTGFDPSIDYAVGDGPNAISLGDFNNDGKLDIATCCWGGGVYILTRNATNNDFTVSSTVLNTGVNPLGIITGDFNNDGKLDLAVTNSGSSSVSVFLRNATNTGFDDRFDYATGATPRSVAAGDFNNDGKLDLAVTNYDGNSVSVLMRSVTNTGFDDKVDYGIASNAASVSVADFNNDGKLDLAVSDLYNSAVSVFLRNTDNTGFDAKVDYPVNAGPFSISTGDFNYDGKQDIAATGWYGTVSVLLRNSSNTGFDPKIDLATDSSTYALNVGDINNDGKLDIISSTQHNTISVFLNNSSLPISSLSILDITAPVLTLPPRISYINTSFDDNFAIATGTLIGTDANKDSLTYGITNGTISVDGLTVSKISSYGMLTVIKATGDYSFIPNDAAIDALTNAVNDSFAVTVSDGFLSDSKTLAINIKFGNPPTLTSFASAVASGKEDSAIPVTFTQLQTKGNEADSDGSVTSFRVKAVSAGTLKIGASATTATLWNALSNNAIDATHKAFWTPAVNANGTLNAFTVVAKDNVGMESLIPVQAKVAVTPVVDVNVIAGVNPIEGGTGTFAIILDSPAPAAGLTVNYTLAGTAALTTDYTVSAGSNITAVTGSSFTVAAGQTSAVLNINAPADNIFYEINKTVNLTLNTGVGYQLAPSSLIAFSPKVDYATGLNPTAVSTGDFNNDGKLDLVITNYGSDTISVLLRNTDNTGFDAKTDYATGSVPLMARVGDFNSDGKLDLVVANKMSNTVSVLLRNDTNTGFDAKVDYATGTSPWSVSVGDFNNDGKLDLATANFDSNTVSVLLRNAANTGFEAKVDYVTGSNPASVSVGDFNNDGKTDLAVANYYGDTVSVLLRNAANSGFEDKVDYATGITPTFVNVGDFNSDGKTDIAVADFNGGSVSVLLRNASNTGFDTNVDYATGVQPRSVSVSDFNNDGKLDLAVANYGSNTVSVLLRNDTNTGFETKVDYATGSSPHDVNVGDLNGDGKVDLTVANNGNNTVSVLLNNPTFTSTAPTATLSIDDHTFAAPITNPFGLNVNVYASPTFADIDADGDLDAFVGDYSGDTVFFRNTGTASNPVFSAPSIDPFGLTNLGVIIPVDYNWFTGQTTYANVGYAAPTFADIDGDGDLDAFVSDYSGDTVFFQNTGTASNPVFATPITNPFGLADVGRSARPVFADIDGDGDLDAFIGERAHGDVFFFQNTGTVNNPVFAASVTNPFGLTAVGFSAKPTFVDIDGDGDLDAFVGEVNGNTLFFLNTGTATNPVFAAALTSPFGLGDVGSFASPTFADINGDGDLDAFVGNRDGNILLFLNHQHTANDSSLAKQILAGGSTHNNILHVVTYNAPHKWGAGGGGWDFSAVESYVGGDGVDTVEYTSISSSVNVNLTTGIASGSTISTSTLSGIENIIGSQAADTLIGNASNNVIDGSAGADTIDGGLGLDTLIGGAGNDAIDGGADVDTAEYASASYGITVNLTTGIASGNDIGTDSLVNIENIIGTQAADELIGNTNKNVIYGGAGADTINGGAGADTINGGAGDDILNGAGAKDTLTGGAGHDVFQLTTFSKDTIQDFAVVDDTIQLENAVFTKLTATGALNAANFRLGDTAAAANDYVIYNSSTGGLFYDADGSGVHLAVQIALIGNHAALTVASFVVI